MPLGTDPKSVIDALIARKDGETNDGRKIALVLEGGALRGVYSCGVAQALSELGFSQCFDLLIGTSSGALNCLYLLGDEMDVAHSVYYENAVDKRCLNLFKFPELLNVRWMISEYILDKKRFNDDVVYSSPTEILISATNVSSGETAWFGSQRSPRINFEKAILATAYTPIVCSQKEEIDGELYNDGYVRAAIPIQKAIDEGCTDIVVVPTQPWGYRKTPSGWLSRMYSKWRIRNYSDAYKAAYASRREHYNHALELAEHGGDGFRTLVLTPKSKADVIGNIEKDPLTVRHAGDIARESTLKKLGCFL
ncbi:patatin-like phospholipase family protein [Pseudomonadota bacterium]